VCLPRGKSLDDARMRFSRHARNAMRALGLSANDLTDAIVSDDGWISRDDRGNIMVVGFVNGQRVTLVLAASSIDFVITVYGERGRRR
jgi:hypothetical protein